MNILIMLVAMSLAGSSIVVSKQLTETMPVLFSNTLSLAFAWIVLVPAGLLHFRRWKKASGGSLLRLFRWPMLQALFGMVLFRVFTFFGLRYLTAIEGGLMTAATPGVMALLAFALLREKPDGRRMLAIVAAGAGIAVLNWKTQLSFSSLLGCALILMAAVCESMLTIFRKMEESPIPPLANTFYIVTFGLVLLIPAAVIEGAWRHGRCHLGPSQLSGCLYMGWVATAIAYGCWGFAAPRLDAGVTGILTAAMPLSAAIVSILWLKETPTPRHVLGGVLVIASILISAAPRRRVKLRGAARSSSTL